MTDSSSYLSGKTPISEADIIAENNLRKVLNLTLQAQQDAGISNIDNDLSLLLLPDNPPSFSMSEQIIAAYTLLSPTSKASVSTALNKTQPPSDPNPAPKSLFDVADKLPCSSTPSLYHLDTHRLIINLAEAKCYLPLTLFTADTTQCLYRESRSLKLIKSQHPITKMTVNVIDTSSFGDEKDMDTIDWLKAISHYLVFLKQRASPEIASRFDNQPASSFHSSACPSGDSTTPDHLCLICARTGHKFSNCREMTSAKGSVLIAQYCDRKFSLRSSDSPICITFNLNCPKRSCKDDHTAQHICSWCGATDHGALSRLCFVPPN
ncbi:hypothetical protein PAXRUDRAFT_171053 [Paxillus rubicundulus Ve08.2h10]|uniref:Uncharacterized protein n=1 Tax=Paxillus rubicundulus Ve08.2h10 TaxID=930991 RepID=A0A0D0BXZ0_9AGAM|nr:hypothetical protein PAXRUDRAFT_171053 [Paxillus rubicundulus Ve08.2h10]